MEPPADDALEPSPEPVMQVAMGFWASKVLLSAVEMELFTHLANNPQDLTSLRARVGLHPRSARDFLDALVALGFLDRQAGLYRNAPSADAFLDKRKPSYLGGFLEMANARLYGFWAISPWLCAPASCRTREGTAVRRSSRNCMQIPSV